MGRPRVWASMSGGAGQGGYGQGSGDLHHDVVQDACGMFQAVR